MTREVRARDPRCRRVLGVSELPVIGSQAVHGRLTGLFPIEASRSREVDVAVRRSREGSRFLSCVDAT